MISCICSTSFPRQLANAREIARRAKMPVRLSKLLRSDEIVVEGRMLVADVEVWPSGKAVAKTTIGRHLLEEI